MACVLSSILRQSFVFSSEAFGLGWMWLKNASKNSGVALQQ